MFPCTRSRRQLHCHCALFLFFGSSFFNEVLCTCMRCTYIRSFLLFVVLRCFLFYFVYLWKCFGVAFKTCSCQAGPCAMERGRCARKRKREERPKPVLLTHASSAAEKEQGKRKEGKRRERLAWKALPLSSPPPAI